MKFRPALCGSLASALLFASAAGAVLTGALVGSRSAAARSVTLQETPPPPQEATGTAEVEGMQTAVPEVTLGEATPAPTATRPPPAVAYLTPPPVVEFPTVQSSRVAPNGIREAIGFTELGARPASCTGSASAPVVLTSPPMFPYERPSWNKPLELVSCGWQPGETVTVSVALPGSRSAVVGRGRSDARGGVVYVFEGSRSDPFGAYRFTFSGARASAQLVVPLGAPASARLYLESDGFLYLYGFKPAELVRLFEYCEPPGGASDGRLPLTAWQLFTVDDRGQLLVKLSRTVVEDRGVWAAFADKQGRRRCHYIAVGAQSSEVHVAGEWTDANFRPISALGVKSVRAETGADRLRVRAEPGNAAPDITRVPNGTELKAISAFVQEDGLWWHVALPDGQTGWVMDRFVTRLYR